MDWKPCFAYRCIRDENGERFEEMARDANGFTMDSICGSDEYAMLIECGMTTDTGIRLGMFTYPSCPRILFERGWVTEHWIDDGSRIQSLGGRVA